MSQDRSGPASLVRAGLAPRVPSPNFCPKGPIRINCRTSGRRGGRHRDALPAEAIVSHAACGSEAMLAPAAFAGQCGRGALSSARRHAAVLPQRRRARVTPARWRGGPRVTLLNIGRASSKDAAYDVGVAEYTRRLAPTLALETRWVRPAAAEAAVLDAANRGATVVLLDGRGRVPRDSVEFSRLVFHALESGGSRAVFVVGDADGLPDTLVQHALGGATPKVDVLSLGPLTLTHRMCRLFLVEQLYRASEIRRGSGYHK